MSDELERLRARVEELEKELALVVAAWDRTVFSDDLGDHLGGDEFRARIGAVLAKGAKP